MSEPIIFGLQAAIGGGVFVALAFTLRGAVRGRGWMPHDVWLAFALVMAFLMVALPVLQLSRFERIAQESPDGN